MVPGDGQPYRFAHDAPDWATEAAELGLAPGGDAGDPEAVQKWVERQCDVALASGVDPKEVGALLREARSQDRARDIGDDFGL